MCTPGAAAVVRLVCAAFFLIPIVLQHDPRGGRARLDVELPPGTEITLTLTLALRAYRPSYRVPVRPRPSGTFAEQYEGDEA
jgi:hypothetical protein